MAFAMSGQFLWDSTGALNSHSWNFKCGKIDDTFLTTCKAELKSREKRDSAVKFSEVCVKLLFYV